MLQTQTFWFCNIRANIHICFLPLPNAYKTSVSIFYFTVKLKTCSMLPIFTVPFFVTKVLNGFVFGSIRDRTYCSSQIYINPYISFFPSNLGFFQNSRFLGFFLMVSLYYCCLRTTVMHRNRRRMDR